MTPNHGLLLLLPVWNSSPPVSLCSVSSLPLLSVFSFVFLPHFSYPSLTMLLFLSFLHQLYFLIGVILCALFAPPRLVLWLINLTYSMPDLDFDIDVTTLLVSDLSHRVYERALCMCNLLTLNYDRTVNQTLFEIGYLATGFSNCWSLQFFGVSFFIALRERCFNLLNNTFCCCAEFPSCK